MPINLTWFGQGRNRVTYDLQPHWKGTSATPSLGSAPVIWEGSLTLQWDNARERGTVVMNGLVMKKCHLIKPCLANSKARNCQGL